MNNKQIKQLTPQQLELLENLEAIDRRSNRKWITGDVKPDSTFAEQYRKRIYEPDS